MESTNHIKYEIEKSAERIDNILSSGSGNYEDKEKLPSRNNLSYANGFYVNVSALFIDIVGSSSMTDVHNRPVLAKTYRCFISECTAIINSSILCEEININGDCVWGVFDTASKSDIDIVEDGRAVVPVLHILVEVEQAVAAQRSVGFKCQPACGVDACRLFLCWISLHAYQALFLL